MQSQQETCDSIVQEVKPITLDIQLDSSVDNVKPTVKKKRGRKPKPKTAEDLKPKVKKKRGRKPKPKTAEDLKPKIRKKRGRKPKKKFMVFTKI